MRIYLEYSDGKSKKFWEGVVRGRALTTRWGAVGSDGQSKTFELDSESAAEAELTKKARAKTNKGYDQPAAVPESQTSGPKKPLPKSSSVPVSTKLMGSLVPLSDHPRVLAFSPDGTSLAVHGISCLHLVDVGSRTWTKTLPSREARALLLGDSNLYVGTKTMTAIDVRSGKKTQTFKGHQAAANCLALADDGRLLFSAGGNFIYTDDRFLRAFDTSTGNLKWKAKPGKSAGALSVAVVEDTVGIAAEDGYVRTFGVADGILRGEVKLGPDVHNGSIFGGVARSGCGLVASNVVERNCMVTWIALTPAPTVDAVTPIPLQDVDPSEGVMAGTPLVQGGHVVVPVYYCVEGYSRVVIAIIDEASRTLLALRAPEGLNDPRCCALSPDGSLAWAVVDGVAIATVFEGS